MARPRKYAPDAAAPPALRQAARRARLAASGGRVLQLVLEPEDAAALQAFAEARGLTLAEAARLAIRQAR